MSRSTRAKTPSDLLAEHVARALCMRRVLEQEGANWPNESILKRVEEEWPNHLQDALTAIGAMGDALKDLARM